VDGRASGSPIDISSDVMATTADINIGRQSFGSREFEGLIDEVKIFNYALTAQQVKDIMNDGTVRFGP
jgi:hypothetical protein